MFKTLASSALTAAALVTSACALPAIASAQSVNWTSEQGSRNGNRVHLTTNGNWPGRSHSNWSFDERSQGLAGVNFQAFASGPVLFALLRDAGRLDCQGRVSSIRGAGNCAFTADAAFADYLASRGIARPDRRTSFDLTMSGANRALVEALAASGSPTPTLNDLTALSIHGASAGFVRSLAAAGYPSTPASKLVAFRIHGVDAAYIRGLGEHNPRLRALRADELIAMRIHGVTPAQVRELARLGYGDLGSSDLVAMNIHGVTPAFITGLTRLGYRDLPASKLITLKMFGPMSR
ncbi:MAG TPA: hypothetical protein VNI79_03850 [Sphingomicrobium sp.]|nr:hypothetical protein [Sphingomicrobium sp.]